MILCPQRRKRAIMQVQLLRPWRGRETNERLLPSGHILEMDDIIAAPLLRAGVLVEVKEQADPEPPPAAPRKRAKKEIA